MRFQDKGVEDFVREAEAQGVNSFELAARQSEDTCHCGSPMRGSDHCPSCGCELWESYCDWKYNPAVEADCTAEDPNHPGLTCNLVVHGPLGHYALGYHWDSDTPAQAEIRAARTNPQGECTCYFQPSADGQTVTRGEDAHCPIAEHHSQVTQAELNAFADAVEDYVRAFDREEEPARLRYEAQDLLARFGGQA